MDALTPELREIRTFLVLAEELHFGRVAERLTLSPSRVSQMIRLLETRVGEPLFARTSRHVELTPLGARLERELRPGYELIERAFVDVRESVAGVNGEVRLGMYSPANGGPHLVEIIKRFGVEHPGCSVTTVDTGMSTEPFDALRTRSVDMLAIRLPVSAPDIVIGPALSSEPRVLAIAADHPLADRDAISYEELAAYTINDVPQLPRELIDALVPPRTPSGVTLRRAIATGIADTMLRVAVGELVHPTVPSFIDYHGNSGIVTVPIRDLPNSQTALVWLRRDDASVRRRAFVRTAEQVLGEHDA